MHVEFGHTHPSGKTIPVHMSLSDTSLAAGCVDTIGPGVV